MSLVQVDEPPNNWETRHKKSRKQKTENDDAPIPPPDVIEMPPGDPWPRPYYFEDGLRRVLPYHYTYNTWVKERWRGRTLFEVFEDEFRDRPLEYYRKAMEEGKVVVSGKDVKPGQVIGPDHILINGQKISHLLHRHEPPVTSEPIEILHEDEGMIVINKPSGIPVHPAGRYNYNSIVEILRADRGADFVPHPANRLDRLTSGVMFIGKTPQGAERVSAQIMARTVRKEYIARVDGRFPDGEVVCDQPILMISPKLGLNRVRATGKQAKTVFKRLAYYGPDPDDTAQDPAKDAVSESGTAGKPWKLKKGYSIVRCLPVTGRTHQIRVHLQFLGHPIQNDPIYANQKVWGFNLGCDDADGSKNTDEDIITRLSRMGKEDVADAVAYYDERVDEYHKKKAEKMSGELCDLCQTPLYRDPGQHELSLWLHSLRYEDAGGTWSYVSDLPNWALPPEGVQGPTNVGNMEDLVKAVKETNPEIARA